MFEWGDGKFVYNGREYLIGNLLKFLNFYDKC